MAISDFVPTVWSAMFTTKLRDNLVWGSRTNRNYEGEVSSYGNKVKIPTGATSISVADYTPGTDLAAPEDANGTTSELTINKQKAFNFRVDDVNAFQSKPDLMMDAMDEASFQMADQIDDDIMSVFNATYASGRNEAVDQAHNSNAAQILAAIAKQKRAMLSANLRNGELWMVCHPALIEVIENHFLTKSADGVYAPGSTDRMLANGFAGTLLGFSLYVTTKIPQGTGATDYRYFMGRGLDAVTHASQIAKVEAYRLEKQFADGVKGLNVYGSLAVHSDRLYYLNVKKPT